MKQSLTKKYLKGMAFVLSSAMVFQFAPVSLTSVDAAPKTGIVLAKKNKVLSTKKGTAAYIGEKKVDLDLLVRGRNIKKGVKWSTKNKNLIKVDKNGRLTAKANGKAVVYAKYKNKTYKVGVQVRTRAESVRFVDPMTNMEVSELTLIKGESKGLKLSYLLSEQVLKAGGVDSTYLSYLDSGNQNVVSLSEKEATALDFFVKAENVGETEISVMANQTSKAKAGGKYGVKATLKVVVKEKEPEMKFGASQTGVSKIRVQGKALTKLASDYKVKMGGLERPVNTVEVNAEATEAVLTLSSSLVAGEHTVAFKEENTSFTAEAEKFGKIEIPSKALVLDADFPSAKGKIEYKIENQFGEDITKKITNLNVSVASATSTIQPAKGIIEVDNIPASFPIGSDILVSIVSLDPKMLGNGSFTVKLSEKAKPVSVEVKGIYDNVKKVPYRLTANNAAENMKARLLLKVKDQYGRSFPSTDKIYIAFNPGLTGLGMNTGIVYSDKLTVDGEDYIALPFTGTDTVKEGKAEVTFIATTGTGSNNSTKLEIVIAGTKQVSDFTVTPPSEVLAKEKTTFNFVAKNSAGELITDYETLVNPNFGVKLPAAFSFEKVGTTTKLVYDANLDANVNSVTWTEYVKEMPSNAVFTISATGMPKPVLFTVGAPARPVSIKPISVDGLAAGSNTGNLLPKLVVVDNKGREHKDLKIFGDYYFGINKNLSKFTISETGSVLGSADSEIKLYKLDNLSAANLSIQSNAMITEDVVTEDVKIALHKDATGKAIVTGSEMIIKLTAADFKKLTSFEIRVPEKIYAGTTTNIAHVSASDVGNIGYNDVSVMVYGKAKNDVYVKVKNTDFILSDEETISDNTSKTLSPSKLAFKATKNGDFTDKLKIVVNDGVGNTAEKLITISAKKPEVKAVSQSSDILIAGSLNTSTVDTILKSLKIEDNYTNVDFGVNPSTDANKKRLSAIKLVSSSSALVKADWNNTNQLKITGAAAGDKLSFEVSFEGGVKKVLDYIVR